MTSRPRYGAVTAVVALGAVIEPMLQGIAIPVLPQLQHSVGASQESAAWILTSFLVSSAIASPVGGRLGDRYGRTRIWRYSLILIALGALLAAVSPSIEAMIAARVLQGAGAAAVPLSFGILRDQLPRARARNATAAVSALLWVGFASAVAAAGPTADHIGLSWLFFGPAVTAVVVASLSILLVPESGSLASEPIALVPAALLSGWLVTLLLGFSQGVNHGWLDHSSAMLLTGSAVLFVAWAIAEIFGPVPLVDLRLLRPRAAWCAGLVAFTLGMALFASMGLLPTFYQAPHTNGIGFAATATESSMITLPSALAGFISGAFAARIATRSGMRSALVGGSLASAAGMVGFALAHDQVWQAVVATTCVSVGAGVVFSNMANVVLDAVPDQAAGTALGVNANIRIVGGALGTAVAVTIVNHYRPENDAPSDDGYMAAFLFLAAMSVVAAVVASLTPRPSPIAGLFPSSPVAVQLAPRVPDQAGDTPTPPSPGS